jgi:hypothetical protein
MTYVLFGVLRVTIIDSRVSHSIRDPVTCRSSGCAENTARLCRPVEWITDDPRVMHVDDAAGRGITPFDRHAPPATRSTVEDKYRCR